MKWLTISVLFLNTRIARHQFNNNNNNPLYSYFFNFETEYIHSCADSLFLYKKKIETKDINSGADSDKWLFIADKNYKYKLKPGWQALKFCLELGTHFPFTPVELAGNNFMELLISLLYLCKRYIILFGKEVICAVFWARQILTWQKLDPNMHLMIHARHSTEITTLSSCLHGQCTLPFLWSEEDSIHKL